MKSALHEVVGLYEKIFEDLSLWHPSIKVELSRDISRLREASLSSGLPLFTITLPNMVKYLQRSLDQGFLVDEHPPLLGAKSKLDKRPKLFYGLWSAIFEADGTLKSEPDISAVKSLRQVFLAVKKLNMKCEQRYVDKTIAEFIEIERSLPASWDDTWDCDNPIWSRRDGHPIWGAISVDSSQANLPFDSTPVFSTDVDFHWAGFRDFVARFSAQLGDLHPFEIRPKHGPGAVSDRSSYTKYDGLFWTHRLEAVFPYDWFGAPSMEHLDYVQYKEYPSRLIAVPKTQSGPRLIACEPTCHQWIQGGIQRWLEKKIELTILSQSIDFRSQDTSRNLALESSLSGDLCTVDLSSASDRLTTRLVEYCFQGNRSLLDALQACRTRCVEVSPNELILLRKFSTQGSACTFPVQTVVYALLCVWAIALTRKTYDWHSLSAFAQQVRVFGDDIIIPTDAYPVLTALLETCKLKVNTSKSYASGKFRESCGMDAYDGIDVTPAYFRQLYSPAPTSLESVVECSNNFYKQGYWRTADYILKTVPIQERKKLLVKHRKSGAFGLVSICGDGYHLLKQRWNHHYHRIEAQALGVFSKTLRNRGRGHGDLLQFFVEEPDSLLPYQGGEISSVKGRKSLAWVVVP